MERGTRRRAGGAERLGVMAEHDVRRWCLDVLRSEREALGRRPAIEDDAGAFSRAVAQIERLESEPVVFAADHDRLVAEKDAALSESHDALVSLWARTNPEDTPAELVALIDRVLGADHPDGLCGSRICAQLAEKDARIAELERKLADEDSWEMGFVVAISERDEAVRRVGKLLMTLESADDSIANIKEELGMTEIALSDAYRERDEARAEVARLREQPMHGLMQQWKAQCRAAEQERDRLREALESLEVTFFQLSTTPYGQSRRVVFGRAVDAVRAALAATTPPKET